MLISILFFQLLFIACEDSKIDPIAYRISEQDLIPEGITYSSSQNSFYLSSIYKKKIVQIDAETGEFKDFFKCDSLGLRVLGMLLLSF